MFKYSRSEIQLIEQIDFHVKAPCFNLIFNQYVGLYPHFGLEISPILGCPLLLRQAASKLKNSNKAKTEH